jgi:hypothetical protein
MEVIIRWCFELNDAERKTFDDYRDLLNSLEDRIRNGNPLLSSVTNAIDAHNEIEEYIE